VVEQSTHDPKYEGSNLAGERKLEKMSKLENDFENRLIYSIFNQSVSKSVSQGLNSLHFIFIITLTNGPNKLER
jgi:hypothetical protein